MLEVGAKLRVLRIDCTYIGYKGSLIMAEKNKYKKKQYFMNKNKQMKWRTEWKICNKINLKKCITERV
jgi:hypothetical protein